MNRTVLEVALSSTMREWAAEKTENHVKGNSFLKSVDTHHSVLCGYLGEAAFQHVFPQAKHIDVSKYDFLLGDEKIDVKTWWSNVKPLLSYYVQIPTVDLVRGAGLYTFTCVLADHSKAFLVGWIECDEFRTSADFRKKGTRRQSHPRITYTTDCLEMQILQLKDIRDLISLEKMLEATP